MTAAVDLTDLDLWARGVPYGEFARLRRDAPVAWFPDEGSGFWGRAVALAALARRVSRFELAGRPRRIRSNFTNGLKELPVLAYR
jgi:hypothetical protein